MFLCGSVVRVGVGRCCVAALNYVRDWSLLWGRVCYVRVLCPCGQVLFRGACPVFLWLGMQWFVGAVYVRIACARCELFVVVSRACVVSVVRRL